MVATSLVMVTTSLVMVTTSLVMVEKSVGKKCDLLACAFKNTLLLMLVLFDIVYIILLLKLEMKENWQVRGPLQPCAAGDILKSIFEHFKRSLFGFCHF